MTLRLLLLLLALSSPAAAAPVTAHRVIDGDTVEATIEVWPRLFVQDAVRLVGIDAPEMHAPRPCERADAQRAKDRLGQLLAAGRIDVEPDHKDKYGRMVGRVRVDGADVNAALLAEGLAVPWGGSPAPWSCSNGL